MTHPFPTRRSSQRLVCEQFVVSEPFACRHERRQVRLRFRRVRLQQGRVPSRPVLTLEMLPIQPFRQLRSEEHKSELQSLMHHSYAYFCLKKKLTNSISLIPTLPAQQLINNK